MRRHSEGMHISNRRARRRLLGKIAYQAQSTTRLEYQRDGGRETPSNEPTKMGLRSRPSITPYAVPCQVTVNSRSRPQIYAVLDCRPKSSTCLSSSSLLLNPSL